MKKLLCPSMMCADFGNLNQEIQALEAAGIDIFHLDVMDGSFVPNFGMGLQDIAHICSCSRKPCDVHLMIQNPASYIETFINMGCEIVYVHPESDVHIARTLQTIKDLGASAGIAINPGTSYETVKEILPLCEYVMIMSVNPGFAGQQYVSFVDEKCKVFCENKTNYAYKVMIDGACSPKKIETLSKIGVDGFILGTSALFNQNRSYQAIMPELRGL